MSSVTEVRGYIVLAALKYLDEKYDAQDRKRFHDALPAELRQKLPSVNKVEWYPKDDASAVFGGFAMLHKDDNERAYRALFGVGQFVGEGAINTYMRLLLRFLTVPLLVDKLPNLWARDHRGGSISVESFDPSKRSLAVRHVGIGGYNGITGATPGFLTAGFTALGLKNIRTTSPDFSVQNLAPNEATYTVAWD